MRYFGIKILSGEEEYIPKKYNEILEINIAFTENTEEFDTYSIVQIQEENDETTANILKDVELKNKEIIFKVEELYTYVIIKLSDESQQKIETNEEQNEEQNNGILGGLIGTMSMNVITGVPWDGSIATEFKYGSGTQSKPYLITDGSELAYLASRVNSGTTYEGIYFQLTNDINLNGRTWTPIGTYSNSFRGIFDGAGYTISNATITISSLPTSVLSYGIFGSIGGGNTSTEIKNVEFNDITISITATGTTGNNTTAKGYNIGIVTGTMFRNSHVTNVIVKNSTISNTGTFTIRTNSTQILVGGIAGDAVNTSSTTTDPGSGSRYSIENCYVSTNISLGIASQGSNLSYLAQYNVGGIIGRIRSQPVWPENCLFTGSINATNGFTGPIFGALRNNTAITSTGNFATLWNGNDAGSLTMTTGYYTNYTVRGTAFIETVTSGDSTSRYSTSSSNIGYVQGVNKGIYTTDMNAMLTMFNNYAGNNYVSWKYENGNFSFISRLTAKVEENPEHTYSIQVKDNYSIGNYTYEWHVNGTLDSSITGDTYVAGPSFSSDRDILVLISDGSYYTVVEFNIPKLYISIEFNINKTTATVTASLTGTALPYININDYTFSWYLEDITGLEAYVIEGADSLVLTGLQDGYDYKLVATHNNVPELSVEDGFVYGDRTVIFVNYSSGNDSSNDGLTPQTPVRTIETAYGKLSSSGTIKTNIIVLIGSYTSTTYLNSASSTTYNKQVTMTGYYKKTDYSGTLTFSGSKYLISETVFQYITLTGNAQTMFYLQGNSMTIGERVVMSGYPDMGTASNGQLTNVTTPDFHLIGGYLDYNRNNNTTNIPNNNSIITIKSGTYGRIITGCRNTRR